MAEPLIEFHGADVEFVWDHEEKAADWILSIVTLEEEKLQHLNIIWCSDEYLLKINQDHLKHDYYTDIITFHYQEEVIDGELYISIDRVKENAEKLKITFEQELKRVVIHGVLHLCGYGDKSEEEIKLMREKEELSMALFEHI